MSVRLGLGILCSGIVRLGCAGHIHAILHPLVLDERASARKLRSLNREHIVPALVNDTAYAAGSQVIGEGFLAAMVVVEDDEIGIRSEVHNRILGMTYAVDCVVGVAGTTEIECTQVGILNNLFDIHNRFDGVKQNDALYNSTIAAEAGLQVANPRT